MNKEIGEFENRFAKNQERVKIMDTYMSIDGKPTLFKQFAWTEVAFRIEVDATENEEDAFSPEPEGDAFYKSYNPDEFYEAIKKYVELVEKKWEYVCLSILSHHDERAVLTIRFYEDKIHVITAVNMAIFDRESAEKLSKIKQILEERSN